MPEVLYCLLKELALLRIELSAGFAEKLEHFPHVKQVLLEHAANHNHTVQVQETLVKGSTS
jgi:hypothetical protein